MYIPELNKIIASVVRDVTYNIPELDDYWKVTLFLPTFGALDVSYYAYMYYKMNPPVRSNAELRNVLMFLCEAIEKNSVRSTEWPEQMGFSIRKYQALWDSFTAWRLQLDPEELKEKWTVVVSDPIILDKYCYILTSVKSRTLKKVLQGLAPKSALSSRMRAYLLDILATYGLRSFNIYGRNGRKIMVILETYPSSIPQIPWISSVGIKTFMSAMEKYLRNQPNDFCDMRLSNNGSILLRGQRDEQ
ncbi:MAG: hypothetical protein KatS3mg087_1332 [Patescibacteria group bacterium]|nr:MAG: hypothetical protein KatS3mg087_1332 [Patescibacteria group bacterium]